MDLREYLKENILLFDGGMGTYIAQRAHIGSVPCELFNLSHPELIADIHREYLDAGCRAIKTNTFGANRIAFHGDEQLVKQVVSAGWSLAAKAAEDTGAWVFADIGPVTMKSGNTKTEDELRFVADLFLEAGAKNFLFETNADTEGLLETAEYIRSKEPKSYIILSFAVQPDGYTRDGRFAEELFREVCDRGCADAVGLNCVCGARHMLELAKTLDHGGCTLSLMPNAGYPVVLNHRTFYEGDPAYFASQLAEMAALGAGILGGCCGTTPRHIYETARVLPGQKKPESPAPPKQTSEGALHLPESLFLEKLRSGKKTIAVELDPPADVNLSRFMSGAWTLKEHGTDVITIADCPIARARMDSSLLACKLRRELNLEALPHMTCRDRNLNATKALLMGLYAEGIRHVLLVTGDPIPSAERDEVKSVYQFNSRKLAAFASGLSRSAFPTPMYFFGALNINARNFDVQLGLAKEKLEKGMCGFLTQPVLSPEAFENLKRARSELGGYLLGGIIPVVSARNARFMDAEINGIRVDPQITELYEGKSREEAEDLAVEISTEIARRITPFVDGYYLMTPFQRTGLICRIIDGIRSGENTKE